MIIFINYTNEVLAYLKIMEMLTNIHVIIIANMHLCNTIYTIILIIYDIKTFHIYTLSLNLALSSMF